MAPGILLWRLFLHDRWLGKPNNHFDNGMRRAYICFIMSTADSVGIDLVDIPRIKNAIDRYGDRFLSRVFTPWEIQYCLSKINPELSFAGRFAVKEAVFKAIGTGFAEGVKWTSVEIVNDRRGQPEVRLGQAIRRHIGSKKIIVSLSHTREYAVASAILISEKM